MEKFLLDYWIALYKQKKVILTITVISVVTTVALSFYLDPVYEAKALFYVPSLSPAKSYLAGSSTDKMARDILIPNSSKEEASAPYIGMLKSKSFAEAIHKEFPSKDVMKLMLFDVNFNLTDEFMLEIFVRDKDPKIAADIANAYIRNLNNLLQNVSLNTADVYLLNNQVADTEKQLLEAKAAIKSFEEENKIASLPEELKILTDQRSSFQTAIENAEVQIRENKESIKAYTDELKKENQLISENNFILTNSSIDHLEKKLSDQAAQIASSSVELKEEHPEVKGLKNQYNETSGRLKKEIQNLVSSQVKPGALIYEELRQKLINALVEKNKLQATLDGCKEAVNRLNARLKLFPAINSRWNSLNDNVERAKKVYEQLKMTLKEAQIQDEKAVQYVVVVDHSKPPKNPSFPIMWINISISLIFGVIAGVFYAFLLDYIESTRTARTSRIIKEVLAED